MTATGMAMRRGQGVAMTRTARKRSDWPLKSQLASGDGEGERGVPAADPVAEPLDVGAAFLGGVEDFDDFGVARVAGESSGSDREGGVAVDGSGEDGGAGDFVDQKGFAGEIGLIHAARP